MSIPPSISLSSLQDTTLDYAYLKREGLAYIESLASELWTDYNAHDPGITMLDMLCYALTDLAARTQLPIKDLLAETSTHSFLTARQILPNQALTDQDYRKLLIDQSGIRDAKIVAAEDSEVPFFFLENCFKLSYADTKNPLKPLSKDNTGKRQTQLGGTITNECGEPLVGVSVLVKGTSQGSLTNNAGKFSLNVPNGGTTLLLSYMGYQSQEVAIAGVSTVNVSMMPTKSSPRLHAIHLKGLKIALLDLPDQHNETWIEETLSSKRDAQLFHFLFEPYHEATLFWFTKTEITAIDLGPVRRVNETSGFHNGFKVEAKIYVKGTKVPQSLPLYILPKQAVQPGNLAIQNAIKHLLTTLNEKNPIIQYRKRLQNIHQLIRQQTTFLHAHRNLGEDWLKVQLFQIQQVGIRIQGLELYPGIDPEAAVGQIYLEVDQFLSPSPRFEPLDQLRENGMSPEEIFEGPLLKHGFLSDQQLEASDREGSLYSSDLIALIMNIELDGKKAVVGLRGLELVSYLQHKQKSRGKNRLPLEDPTRYKVKFSPFHSVVEFHEANIWEEAPEPLTVGISRFRQLQKKLVQVSPPGTADLPVPKGKKRDVQRYFSIQEDFPQSYKLRTGALTEQDDPLRTVQVKQLKAYLLFFEQLLANYCAQLANLQELFSTNPGVSQTYFFQPLRMVPEVYNVITDFPGYEQGLKNIAESPDTFLQRRNQILDHLLARFSESFADYAAKAYQGSQTFELIHDKLNFLNSYPSLSANRASACNYQKKKNIKPKDSGIWNTENVSGFEKRVAKLLGIPNFRRRHLWNPGEVIPGHVQRYDEKDKDYDPELRFRITLQPISKDPKNKIILSSSKKHSKLSPLEEELQEVKEHAQDRKNYEIFLAKNKEYYFNLLNAKGEVIARRIEPFETRDEIEQEIQKITDLFQGRTDEGFHLIEHILLRPRDNTFQLLKPLNRDFPSANPKEHPNTSYRYSFIRDPYSAQVTLILPTFIGRFQKPGFRGLVEKMIHQELPAHLFAYVIWVDDPKALKDFETVYKNWLTALNTGKALSAKTNALIKKLSALSEAHG